MKIKNWKKYQHYKDRSPPWIKLHRTLLDDRDFHDLSPLASKVLVMCWLLAAEDEKGEGNIPNAGDIAFRIRMDESKVKTAILSLNHWIEDTNSDVLAGCQQVACLETEVETEVEKEVEGKTESQNAPPPKDPNFRDQKENPNDAFEICELAVRIYKNTQHSSQIMPTVVNLLASLDKETIIKAIENESTTMDMNATDHRYRPSFAKHFSMVQTVKEMSNRSPVAPVDLAEASRKAKDEAETVRLVKLIERDLNGNE